MCGCAEKMPVVSRADCTEAIVNIVSFRFTPSAEGANITLGDAAVEFKPCWGARSANWDEQRNDLLFHYKLLVEEGKASIEDLLRLRRFILPPSTKNCSSPAVNLQDDDTRKALRSQYSDLVRDAVL